MYFEFQNLILVFLILRLHVVAIRRMQPTAGVTFFSVLEGGFEAICLNLFGSCKCLHQLRC